jgi:phosphatidylglycerol---prolipoprotein diacylglyceryl transferase
VTPIVAGAVHTAFEWLAIFAGARLYLRTGSTSLRDLGKTRNYAVILGCIVGAAIGNKAVHWFHHADHWYLLRNSPWLILQGQSIVGGLLGGLIGVEIGKKVVGLTESTGDRFVMPILLGLIVGRIGCFIVGLQDDTFGDPTTLPWAVDFGDGVPRHPTQLYDIGFALVALAVLHHYKPVLARESGLQFKLMLAGYLLWRLAIDGLKPVPYAWPGGLSGIQLTCLAALLIYLPMTLAQLARLPREGTGK